MRWKCRCNQENCYFPLQLQRWRLAVLSKIGFEWRTLTMYHVLKDEYRLLSWTMFWCVGREGLFWLRTVLRIGARILLLCAQRSRRRIKLTHVLTHLSGQIVARTLIARDRTYKIAESSVQPHYARSRKYKKEKEKSALSKDQSVASLLSSCGYLFADKESSNRHVPTAL